jgi:hypothetical protein
MFYEFHAFHVVNFILFCLFIQSPVKDEIEMGGWNRPEFPSAGEGRVELQIIASLS